jgi:4'-phosphopantetheinyl transferase EntD
MLEEILPQQVAVAEARKNVLNIALFPEEKVALGEAVGKRCREFTSARACARAALARLGVPPAPIVPGHCGAPQWPSGIVGSMTHRAGYSAAAIARAEAVLTIGVDAELDDWLPRGVLRAIATADEHARLRALPSAPGGPCWDRLLFSAKESVYKAWFPLTQRRLGFADTSITINPADGTFRARLLVPGPVLDGHRLGGFTGRWLAREGLILTAIAVL